MSKTQNIMNLIWEQNQDIADMMNKNIKFVESSIQKYEELGLSYIDNDYYVYKGKGGLKIHETPKGVKKRIAQIAHKYDLSVVVTDGVFYEGDKIDVVSDGTIEDISIKKNSQALIMGGEILAPYAIVSVFKDDTMITRKLFIVPNDEYVVIKNMGSGNKFQTMMAYKMVYKRVLNGIFSLLGVTLDREDSKDLDIMAENMRVDNEDEVDTVRKIYKTASKVTDDERLEYKKEFMVVLKQYDADALDFFSFVGIDHTNKNDTHNAVVQYLRSGDLFIEQLEAYSLWKIKQNG